MLRPIFILVSMAVFIISCASSVASKAEKNTKLSVKSSFHHQFLKQVNNVRSKGRKCGQKYFPPAPSLTLDKKLNQAAYRHSQDMFQHQFLEHESSNGDTLVERMMKAKYAWRAVAENIAHNQKSTGQVIDDWLSSPGHCSNMMSKAYTHTGIANVNRYWTQVYATPK